MRQRDWGSAVEYFRRELNVDVVGEYERLKEMSKIPVDKITDPYYISTHINGASNKAHKAFLIYHKARRQKELFEIDFNKKMRELSRLAMARIANWMEKTSLPRKQITQSMILEEIAAGSDTSEEYRDLVEKMEELKDIKDAMQNFAQMWSDRRSSLQTQASLAKTKREVILDSRK